MARQKALRLLAYLILYFPLPLNSSREDVDLIDNLMSTMFPNCFKSIVINQESTLHDETAIFENLNSLQNGNINIWTAKPNGDGNLSSNNVDDKIVAKRTQCSVGLISLHSFNPELITSWIHKLDGKCNRDTDYFIFHMHNLQSLDELLLSPKVSVGVKFKIGISSERFQEKLLTVRSVCTYCNNGHPKLVTLEVLFQNQLSFAYLFPNYVKDFHGYKMTISTPLECLWLTEIRLGEDGQWKPIRGYHNYGIFHLMRKLNFTSMYIPSFPNGGTGTRSPNGTWNGVVGDVLYGRTEIGQATAQLFSRTLVVDFFFPFTYEWLGFTTGEPRPYFSWRGAYRPLTGEVWFLIFFSAVLMGFVIKLFGKLAGEKFCAKVVVEFIVRSLLEQGDDSLEKSTVSTSFSTKVLSLFWLIFVMIVMTGYKSKLVTFLAFPFVDNPPTSFESLADSSYEIILQYTGAAYHLITSSNNPTYKKISQKFIKEPSDARCLQMILEKKAACISWANIVTYVSHKNFSHSYRGPPFVKAPASGYFVQGALVTRKRSIYTEEINFYNRIAMSMGIVAKWQADDNVFVANERRSWEEATNKTSHDSRSIRSTDHVSDELNMTHLAVAFYILWAGSSFGMLTFLYEVWKVRWKIAKISSFLK